MINKISAIQGINQPKISFKSEREENLATSPITSTENKGLEALAAYNKPLMEELNIKPSPLLLNPNVDPKQTQGEKIYTSDGKLHSIIKNNESTKVIYNFNTEDDNEFNSLQVLDKNSGKMIKEQIGYDFIAEYDPISGKIIKSTEYENGQPVYVHKSTYKNGNEKDFNYNILRQEYNVFEYNNKTKDHSRTTFDKNKQIQFIEASKTRGIMREEIEVNFYNGSAISASKTEHKTIPNTMGREAMNLDNLEPREKVDLGNDDLRAFEGEKTYYSNGFVETNTIIVDDSGEYMTCFFSPSGKLEKIANDNITIIYENKEIRSIEEKLADGSTKTTTFFDDGSNVSIQNENDSRSIYYDKNGNIESYRDNKLSLYFNKEGMLEEYFRNND